MTKKYRRKKSRRKLLLHETALDHINTLFNKSQQISSQNLILATRYVKIARKVGMKVRTKIPSKYQFQFCKYCYSYLIPGKNARVRLRQKRKSHIVVTCLVCKRIARYPFK
ncbi:MAG: ribonuclease P protein component 4 [Promethearchaeota archaeon]